MPKLTCGFIGLGLIGGSIARALRASRPDIRITAVDTNQNTLLSARKEGVADAVSGGIDSSLSDCDYIFLCAPVRGNESCLEAVRKIMKPGCLLTDVGSVKTPIHKAVHDAGLDACFIGGHPMAGSERTGYANSKAALLENAYYILTPSSVSGEQLDSFRELIAGTGAIPLVMDYEKHDYITAAISHLPHVMAAALVNLVRQKDDRDGMMKMIAAGGFKDITRIASSSAVMWQQICLANTENISSLLSDYIDTLSAFRRELDRQDERLLYEQFETARIYRDSFIGAPSGPIKRSYCVNVEIADKSGALADVVTLLAGNRLSIKNIGITHNRESEDGVLKLEFPDEASMNAAARILQAARHTVHLRT